MVDELKELVLKKWQPIIDILKDSNRKVLPTDEEIAVYAERLIVTYSFPCDDHLNTTPIITTAERIRHIKLDLKNSGYLPVMLDIYCRYGIKDHEVVYKHFIHFVDNLPDNYDMAEQKYVGEIYTFMKGVIIRLRKDKLKKLDERK